MCCKPLKKMSIQDFLKEFEYNLTDTNIDTLSNEAKISAVNCGKSNINKVELNLKTWNLFDEISGDIWCGDLELKTKIKLGFDFFHKFPSYYHFLIPFYHLIMNKELENNIELKDVIWSKFMTYLSLEKYYSDTVAYVLWVEFFEDGGTRDETWKGLLKHSENEKSLLVLIENSGPVDFDLKEPVYCKLLDNVNNHMSIFKSLLHSSFDVYGKTNHRKAKLLLSKLKISSDTRHYKLLIDKINNGLQH